MSRFHCETSMQTPVNFDSPDLDSLLSEWVSALREFAVEALVVLGPDPFGARADREVVAVHPPSAAVAAHALACSDDFGAPWSGSDAPLVAWQHIAKSEPVGPGNWRRLWLARGFQTVIRVEFSLPAGRAFECFLFSPRELHDRAEAAPLVWSTLNIWPLVRRTLVQARGVLSLRERDCLAHAFAGLTARESALLLECTDRTVNYHLANAMAKLKVDNKMAAIQRACWLGEL